MGMRMFGSAISKQKLRTFIIQTLTDNPSLFSDAFAVVAAVLNENITSPADRDIVYYDSAEAIWVNGTLTKTDVGLSNVDNTSDLNKPVSTAQASAIASGDVLRILIADIVDDVLSTDTDKPLSANQGYVLKGLIDSLTSDVTSNDSDISSLQSSKVNISDIIDTVLSTETDQPLSANQGYVLKGLIDTLTSTVSGNTGDISTNTSAISTNAGNISTNSSDITTLQSSKVNVSDIVDNVTSTDTDLPLSANQGYVLKGLIDGLLSGAVVETDFTAASFSSNLYSYTHSLGTRYPNVRVFDANDQPVNNIACYPTSGSETTSQTLEFSDELLTAMSSDTWHLVISKF